MIVKLKSRNAETEELLYQLQTKNADLEEQVAELRTTLNSVDFGAAGLQDGSQPSGSQVASLRKQLSELQAMYDNLNIKNRELRQKAGLVFVNSIGILKGPEQKKNDARIYLEDEDSVRKMMAEIKLQDTGDLLERLNKIGYGEEKIVNQKQFTEFLQRDLKIKENDLMKLLKISGFTRLESQSKTMRAATVAKNVEDRIVMSRKLANDQIK